MKINNKWKKSEKGKNKFRINNKFKFQKIEPQIENDSSLL